MRLTTLRAATVALLLILPFPAAAADDEGFFVLRFDGRITQTDRDAVVDGGLRVVDYEPADSYLVWGTPEEARAARALEGAVAVEPLARARKLHPSLDGGPVALAEVTVYGPALQRARSFLGRLGPVRAAYLASADGALGEVSVPLDAADIDAVLARPEVLFVGPGSLGLSPEDEATDQMVAGNASGGTVSPGYLGWLAQHGLDGSGITVSVADTGISPLHPDFGDRIDTVITYGGVAGLDTGGHGTHVAGIIGGDPLVPARDVPGFLYGLGMAPKVRFVNQNVLTMGSWPPPAGFEPIVRDAWGAGARLWNASWHTGQGERVGYLSAVRQMDEATRNADWLSLGSEEFLFVFSAGNTGFAGPTVPHEAKNIIAVGSTTSGRDTLSRMVSSGFDNVSSFSARGPAQDGRIFPTLSAPGEGVVSARVFEGGTSTAGCIPPPLGAGLYASCSGTSMAAPHVAGSAALVHQWWLKTHASVPSPAMVRALLVNGADDTGFPNVPNRHEGWGRVDLQSVFAGGPAIRDDQGTVFDNPGDTSDIEVTVADPAKPLRVTLAWSDAPAAVGANPTLVNDLDLVVERLDGNGDPIETYVGNRFTGGASVQGGSADRLNNLENVWLPAPGAGSFRITVRAENLPGDGVPFGGDDTDQDFALVVRNAASVL